MKITVRSLTVSASLLAIATLTACVAPGPAYQAPPSYPYGGAPPARYPYGQAPSAYVEFGRVANIELVRSPTANPGTSGGGAVAGGLVGGVLGNQVGKGSGRTAATVLGAVGGALLGNHIEAQQGGSRVNEAYRVSVQTDQGAYRVFDVPNPGELRVGDRVRVENGQISRY